MPVQCRSRDDVIFGRKEKKKDPPPPPNVEAAIKALTPDSSAEEYKNVGNLCIHHEQFTLAIKHYTAAIDRDSQNEILFSNRSAAYLQSSLLSGPSMALKDADRCIKIKPSWFKGHLRRGDALYAMAKFDSAIEAYSQCLSLNPTCTTAIESRQNCQLALQELQNEARSSQECEADKSFTDSNPSPARPAQRPPEVEDSQDPEDLLKRWSADTTTSGTTARKAFSASVDEADRDAGRQAKESFFSSYRKRIESDPVLKEDVEKNREHEILLGDGFNYKTDPARGPRYARGTDAVGHAISADAYKSYTHKAKAW